MGTCARTRTVCRGIAALPDGNLLDRDSVAASSARSRTAERPNSSGTSSTLYWPRRWVFAWLWDCRCGKIDSAAKWALWLLFLSVLASTAVGVWPPAPLDANAFSNYLSSYNALRIFKGYVWAGAMLWLTWRDASAGRKVVPQLQIGLALGLFAATIAVFWVRLQFVGSLDLDTGFRASGLYRPRMSVVPIWRQRW